MHRSAEISRIAPQGFPARFARVGKCSIVGINRTTGRRSPLGGRARAVVVAECRHPGARGLRVVEIRRNSARATPFRPPPSAETTVMIFPDVAAAEPSPGDSACAARQAVVLADQRGSGRTAARKTGVHRRARHPGHQRPEPGSKRSSPALPGRHRAEKQRGSRNHREPLSGRQPRQPTSRATPAGIPARHGSPAGTRPGSRPRRHHHSRRNPGNSRHRRHQVRPAAP